MKRPHNSKSLLHDDASLTIKGACRDEEATMASKKWGPPRIRIFPPLTRAESSSKIRIEPDFDMASQLNLPQLSSHSHDGGANIQQPRFYYNKSGSSQQPRSLAAIQRRIQQRNQQQQQQKRKQQQLAASFHAPRQAQNHPRPAARRYSFGETLSTASRTTYDRESSPPYEEDMLMESSSSCSNNDHSFAAEENDGMQLSVEQKADRLIARTTTAPFKRASENRHAVFFL